MRKETKIKNKNIGGAGDGLKYDEKSKTWGFRIVRDGKDHRRKGFKTKTEAKQARNALELELADKEEQETVYIPTLKGVYEHYVAHGSHEKREATLTKQQSMWKNHINRTFGSRLVNDIKPGEINNYLGQLYIQGSKFNDFETGYEYSYVEGFLKFFYLLFGYSRRMDWITKENYNALCKDVDTFITMPKKQDDDDEDGEITTYTSDEVKNMRERIKNSSLYTAFEIGYYCGLRISECFGLMWEDIDWVNHTMIIRRQMLKSGVHRVLVPCKTTKAKRTLDLPDALYTILKEKKEQQEKDKILYGSSYKGNETVRVRMKVGQDDPLTAGGFINRRPDGTLLSSDSMKSWVKKFKDDLGISFKYHNLRHTHASYLAALNVPIPKLMERLGHKKIETTSKYYLGKNEIADEKLRQSLNML